MRNPSYGGLRPASIRATNAGKAASKKRDTKPELILRKALREVGLRPSQANHGLPGRPDFVFVKSKVVLFCDGDFWHGKDWGERKVKLKRGHNAQYWIMKIEYNIRRDKKNTRLLGKKGWTVIRVWESKIKAGSVSVAGKIARTIKRLEQEAEYVRN